MLESMHETLKIGRRRRPLVNAGDKAFDVNVSASGVSDAIAKPSFPRSVSNIKSQAAIRKRSRVVSSAEHSIALHRLDQRLHEDRHTIRETGSTLCGHDPILATVLDQVKCCDARNCFDHCGYALEMN